MYRGDRGNWCSHVSGEVALPWCVACACMAVYKRRWVRAAAWMLGIAAFCGSLCLACRSSKNTACRHGSRRVGRTLPQWLRFGGLDFVLLTMRMNSLLFAVPGWLLWLYSAYRAVGLSRSKSEASQTACVAALMYLLAFAIVGRPENFYWDSMPAPLLAWGVADSFKFQALSSKLEACINLKLGTWNLELSFTVSLSALHLPACGRRPCRTFRLGLPLLDDVASR